MACGCFARASFGRPDREETSLAPPNNSKQVRITFGSANWSAHPEFWLAGETGHRVKSTRENNACI